MPNETITNASLDNVSEVSVKELIRNKDLRSVKPGSEEYKAALAGKPADKNVESKESATKDPDLDEFAKKDEKDTSAEKPKDPEELVDEGKKKPSRGIQKRFDELTKAEADAKARADALEAELAKVKAEKVAPVKQEAPPASQGPEFSKPKPDYDNFNSPLEYQEALTDWKLEKYQWEQSQAAVVAEAKKTVQAKLDKFLEKGTEIEKELGLEEGEFKILTTADVGIRDIAVRDFLLDDENGAKILYDITSDEDMAKKFYDMNTAQQLILLGRLSGKYEASKSSSSKTETKKVSKAKAPVADLKGAGAKVTSLADPKLNPAEFRRQREEAHRTKGRR